MHDGIPEAADEPDGPSGDSAPGAADLPSVAEAAALVANRERAYGKKHALTFAARAQLGEAVGRSGDSDEAARMLKPLADDQLTTVHHQSPAVLANQYRAAVWTARAGDPDGGLAALRGLHAE